MSKVEHLDNIVDRFGPHLHDAPWGGWQGDRKIDRQCGFHVLVTYRQSPLTHTLVRRGDGAVRLGTP